MIVKVKFKDGEYREFSGIKDRGQYSVSGALHYVQFSKNDGDAIRLNLGEIKYIEISGDE